MEGRRENMTATEVELRTRLFFLERENQRLAEENRWLLERVEELASDYFGFKKKGLRSQLSVIDGFFEVLPKSEQET